MNERSVSQENNNTPTNNNVLTKSTNRLFTRPSLCAIEFINRNIEKLKSIFTMNLNNTKVKSSNFVYSMAHYCLPGFFFTEFPLQFHLLSRCERFVFFSLFSEILFDQGENEIDVDAMQSIYRQLQEVGADSDYQDNISEKVLLSIK